MSVCDSLDRPMYRSSSLIVAAGCYCMRPCIHNVVYNGVLRTMCAREIVKIIQEDERDIPKHFDYILQMILKERWLDLVESGTADEIVSNKLYEDNKQELKTKAIHLGRLDVLRHIFDEVSPNQSDFVVAVKCGNINVIKAMVSQLKGDVSVISEVGSHYVAHGGTTVLSAAAFCQDLAMLKYLVDDVGVQVTGQELFEVMTPFSDASPVIEYLIERMIETNVVVNTARNRRRIIKEGLEDRFIKNGLLKKPVCTVIRDYPNIQRR